MRLSKIIGFIAILTIIVCVSASAVSAAVDVSIDSATVDPGNTTTVNITAHDVTELGEFGIKLEYDTSVVSVTGVQNSPDIPDGFGVSNTTDDGSLSLVSSGMTTPSLTGAEVLLVTVTLEAVGDASDESDLNITVYILKHNNGTDIDATDVDGTFRIAGDVYPTCTVSVTNTTITPPQTTDITMTFSEKVQYTLNIETSDGTVVCDWTGDRKTSYTVEWNGTYEIDGTQVPDGTYTLNLTVTNETTGLSGNNRTETIVVSSGDDTTPPVITNVANTTPTTNSVTITWDTDEDSDSLVKYGTEYSTYTAEEHDATMVVSHSITLTGLDANTTYYFVVNSTDASDNSAESGEHSFRTATPAESGTYISIDSATVDPGNTTTVNITAHDVTELGEFGIKLEYDTSVVSVTGVQNSPDIPDGFGVSNTTDDGSLSLVSSGMTTPSLTGAEVLLVTVTLEAVGDASDESDLNITVYILKHNNGTDIDATDVDGTFRIGAPSTTPPTCTVSMTNATIVPPQTTDITVTFSEKVQYTLNIETSDGTVVRDWSGNRKTSYTVAWNGTYETNGTQVPDGTYTLNLTVTNETTGLSGNNRTETIVVSSGDDTTAPTVTTNAPTGTGIPTSTVINVTFDEAMNETSAEGAFSIDPSVTGSFSWDGCVMTFTTDDDLAYETAYNVTIGTGAEDLAGNPLAEDFVWNFTTGLEPYAHSFVILDPADGTVGTPITVTVEVRDQYDDLVDTYQNNVTLVASGSATGDGLVDIVNGTGSLDISDTVAETVTLSLNNTEETDLNVSSTQEVIFAARDSGRNGGGGGGSGGTYPPGWGEIAPAPAATSAPKEAASPTTTKAPTVAPTKAPTNAPTVAATETTTTKMNTKGTPGFGAVATVFAIAGLLVAAYLVMRRRE